MEHNSSTEFDTDSLDFPFLAWHTEFIASLRTAPTGHYNEANESTPRRYVTSRHVTFSKAHFNMSFLIQSEVKRIAVSIKKSDK